MMYTAAIQAAEPWTVRSVLAGIGLLALAGIGLWRLFKERERR